MKLLEIQNLTAQYRTDLETVHAVNDISLSIDRGESLGLVGETGAGKTTTALSILQLLPKPVGEILSGSVHFDGKDLMAATDLEMQAIRGDKISMIFQDPMTALNPVMTVGEQVREALELHAEKNVSKEELEKEVDKVLKMVGIHPERKKDYPHQFSGGMKQRVIIAMALVCQPELLIADEPTTALDVTIQAQVLSLIKNLKRQLGTAMLMITHDFGVVAQTCDHVAVMYAGEIVEYATVYDIMKEGRHHPYTEGLFKSIPDMEQRSKRLHPIPGAMPNPTDLPEGCSFSPRCTYCTDRCKTEKPGLWKDGSHQIRCFRYCGGESDADNS